MITITLISILSLNVIRLPLRAGLNPRSTYTTNERTSKRQGAKKFPTIYGTVTAATNAQGQLFINAPAIPTMQALYVRQ
jgi:hypothetical protein